MPSSTHRRGVSRSPICLVVVVAAAATVLGVSSPALAAGPRDTASATRSIDSQLADPVTRAQFAPHITTKTNQKVGSRMTVRWTAPAASTGDPSMVARYEVQVARDWWIYLPASARSLNLAVQKGQHKLCVRAVYNPHAAAANCITMHR